jgi:hypothetical protein
MTHPNPPNLAGLPAEVSRLADAAGAVARLVVAEAERAAPGTCVAASQAIRQGAALYVAVTWGHRPTVEVGARDTDGTQHRLASIPLQRNPT